MILLSFVRDQDVDYPFCLIFTQCDLLPAAEIGQQQIAAKAQDLIDELDKAGVNYKCFYTEVTSMPQAQGFCLVSNDVSSVFMWLVTELYEHYRGGTLANLRTLSTLHCLRCGSDRINPSRSISFFKKLWLQITLRKKYRCRDCGASKIEFLPFVWGKKLRAFFDGNKH